MGGVTAMKKPLDWHTEIWPHLRDRYSKSVADELWLTVCSPGGFIPLFNTAADFYRWLKEQGRMPLL